LNKFRRPFQTPDKIKSDSTVPSKKSQRKAKKGQNQVSSEEITTEETAEEELTETIIEEVTAAIIEEAPAKSVAEESAPRSRRSPKPAEEIAEEALADEAAQ